MQHAQPPNPPRPNPPPLAIATISTLTAPFHPLHPLHPTRHHSRPTLPTARPIIPSNCVVTLSMALSSAAAVLRSISKGKAAPPLPPLPQQLGDEAVDGLEGWTDDIYIYIFIFSHESVCNIYIYIRTPFMVTGTLVCIWVLILGRPNAFELLWLQQEKYICCCFIRRCNQTTIGH